LRWVFAQKLYFTIAMLIFFTPENAIGFIYHYILFNYIKKWNITLNFLFNVDEKHVAKPLGLNVKLNVILN